MTEKQIPDRRAIVLRPLLVWLALFGLHAISLGYALLPGVPLKPLVSLAIVIVQASLVLGAFMKLGKASALIGTRHSSLCDAFYRDRARTRRSTLPRGDKDTYTDKQKRKAEHIEEGYEKRGTPKKEAESRAWATVNKASGGGNKSGSGRGNAHKHSASSRSANAHASSSTEQRSASARKGWETRRKNAG